MNPDHLPWPQRRASLHELAPHTTPEPDQILSVDEKAIKRFGLALLVAGVLMLASCALRAFS